jgi:gliding motility-associated-like protein
MKAQLSRLQSVPAFLIFFLLTFTATAQEDALFSWAKNMGGSDADTGGDIAVDDDGNVYTTGYFRNTADFDPGAATFNLTSAGGIDIFITKVDPDGNLVWAVSFGNTGFDRGFGIAVDGDGNVYGAGYFQGTVDFHPGSGTANLTASNTDTYVVKLDTDGNFIWARSVGNSGGDYGRAIAVDAAQNVYVMGEFQNTVDFDPGPGNAFLSETGPNGGDIFILKLDAAGNYAWAISHGGPSEDDARSIEVDAAGNVYSTGGFYATVDFDPGAGVFNLTSTGTDDVFISKLDLNGNFVWAKQIGSTAIERGQGLALDVSGNVYAAGHFNGTVDFDPGAGTFNLTSVQHDAFIVKLDTDGDFVWAKSISGESFEEIYTIDVDNDGDVYTGGKFYGVIDFDPGTGIFNLDVFGDCIVKLDTDGNFEWAIAYTGTSNELGMAIVADNNNNVYVTGQFFEADFDPSACEYELTSTATDIYILKLAQGPAVPEPSITSFDPPAGPPGTEVIITGTNFDPTPSNNTVLFNGTTATVISSTSTTIVTTVPSGASDGEISVSIGCATATSSDDFVTAESGDGLVIYNAVSPDGNGSNEIFTIENVEATEETRSNTVTIYNRWGDVVFDVSNYDNDERVFTGVSNSGKDLPSGIYYYKIEFSSGLKPKTGYLSLKR